MTILAQKKALVTGVTGGVGRSIAARLKAAGCEVVGAGRNPDTLAEARETLGIKVIAADLATPAAVDALIQHTQLVLGEVDILVNSAGVFPVHGIDATTLAEFDRCFSVNVRAPFALCRALAPHMAKRRWGRIVNIGSSSAYAGFRNTSAYCASKHAILGLTRALHDEFKTANVRCFCVSPGSIQTDMGRQVQGQDFTTFLDPQEVGEFIVHLLTYDGNMISEEVRLNRMIIR